MGEKDWLEIWSGQNQLQKVIEMNEKTQRFGLVLSEAEAKMLVESRNDNLRKQQRVEFGEGVLPKLIFAFCDSPYIYQGNYADTMMRLQEIFYLYKNESMDELTDDELIQLMKETFDGECEGDLEYLEDTALEEFARSIRREGQAFFGKHYRIKRRGCEDDEL